MNFFNLFLNLQESWAICRIFKKTNSTAQRALSHSWISSLPETRTSDMLTKEQESTQFYSPNMPLTKKTSLLASQFCTNNNDGQDLTTASSTFCPLDNVASYKSLLNPLIHKAFDHFPLSNGDLNTGLIFSSSPLETISNANAKSSMDVSSMLLNMSSSVLGDFSNNTPHEDTTTSFNGGLQLQDHCHDYLMQATFGNQYDNNALVKVPNVNIVPRFGDQELETVRSIGFPFSIGDAWKSNMLWDTSSNCPCDVPLSHSTTKCYT